MVLNAFWKRALNVVNYGASIYMVANANMNVNANVNGYANMNANVHANANEASGLLKAPIIASGNANANTIE